MGGEEGGGSAPFVRLERRNIRVGLAGVQGRDVHWPTPGTDRGPVIASTSA